MATSPEVEDKPANVAGTKTTCTDVQDVGLVRWFTFQLLSGITKIAVRSRSGVGTSIYVESSKKNTMTFDIGADIPDPSGVNGRSDLGNHIFLTYTNCDNVLALGPALLASQCRGATYNIWVPRSNKHRVFRNLIAHLKSSAMLSGDHYSNDCYYPQKHVEYKVRALSAVAVLCMCIIFLDVGLWCALGAILYSTLLWKCPNIMTQMYEPATARVSFVHRNLIISEVTDAMVVSKQNRIVRAFPTPHKIESNAYVVYDRVCSVGRLESIPDCMYTDGTLVYAPVLTISGDTTCELWTRYPELAESQIVFSEATRMSGSIEDPRKHGHTHVQELINTMWQCSYLVLYKIATRETNAGIKEAVSTFPKPEMVLVGQV